MSVLEHLLCQQISIQIIMVRIIGKDKLASTIIIYHIDWCNQCHAILKKTCDTFLQYEWVRFIVPGLVFCAHMHIQFLMCILCQGHHVGCTGWMLSVAE